MVILLLLSALLAEEPWTSTPPPTTPSSPIGHGLQAIIHFHQTVLSPVDGPRSHFYPSSSEYTRQSLIEHGLLRGFLMGCDRMLRENDDPWVYPQIWSEGRWLKYDPP